MTAPYQRRAWAEVDLGAIRANAAELARLVAPAPLCAVVKANGYGHGAVETARAALAGGASWLAVALVEEGVELRDAGIVGPVLLLSEPAPDAFEAAVTAGLTLTVYSHEGVARAGKAAQAAGRRVPVHVKIDTGMHRVGASPTDAEAIAIAVGEQPGLDLEGVWTHLAVADEPAQGAATEHQLRRFDDALERLARGGIVPRMLHAANTAGGLAHPGSRRDLVRAGIGLYGYSPVPGLAVDLTPAMSVKAEVSFTKRLDAGERVSYGLRYEVKAPANVATVPLGYADGVPRRLSAVGGEVLIGGHRRLIAGTITMDQLMVDCGDDPVSRGDEVVLLGRQGEAEITADDWARRLDTISYEIVCGIGPRVPRVYL